MTTRLLLATLLAMVISYLLGSINFAIIITKKVARSDIRDYGSGNAGMTNVLRTLGKGPATLTLIGDFCKGLVSILLSRLLLTYIGNGSDITTILYVCGIATLLGHLFPVFYGFRGGKGILASAGVLGGIHPLVLACLLAVFLIVVLSTKIVSVASITVAACVPVFVCIWSLVGHSPNVVLETVLGAIIGGLVIFMHRENIKRLRNGTENSFKKKK